jgi:nicotinate-nucleotide pyrophosphorylase (carboxylating)
MELLEFIRASFLEDVGNGDHTSLATIPPGTKSKAKLLVKESGILAGIEVAQKIISLPEVGLKGEFLLKDGEEVKAGDIAFFLEGSAHSILKAERLLLNIMQRMSGIATVTNKYVKEIAGTNTRLLDTRKTTPLLRMLEKQAVRIGGGHNHRFGLYDMILIKDNHVDYAGGIVQAIDNTADYLKEHDLNLKIEIETRNLKELQEVLDRGGVDRIMLDNYTPENLKIAVQMIDHRFESEASGGITLDNIRNYALTGVDYISVGALTHSVKSLDLSLKACE